MRPQRGKGGSQGYKASVSNPAGSLGGREVGVIRVLLMVGARQGGTPKRCRASWIRRELGGRVAREQEVCRRGGREGKTR